MDDRSTIDLIKDRDLLIIQNHDGQAGFCALMTYALNGIRKAQDIGRVPVVKFDKSKSSHFYQPDKGENIWEYYFLPIGGISSKAIDDMLQSGEISPGQIRQTQGKETAYWHKTDPKRVATFWSKKAPINKSEWMSKKRTLGRRLTSENIKVRPHILDKVDEYCRKKMNLTYTFGVHIRGTDFSYAQLPMIGDYFTKLDQLIEGRKQKPFQIFVATDQQQHLDSFKKRYVGLVISHDSIRSSNSTAPFMLNNANNYQKGEDVLIELLILSKCDYILKGPAALGEFALWFNDEAEFTDFSNASQFVAKKASFADATFYKQNIAGKSQISLSISRYTIRFWKLIKYLLFKAHQDAINRIIDLFSKK